MEHTLCEFSKYCWFAKKFSSRSFLNDTKKCEFYQHVERNEKFVVKYFWTPTKWSKVRAPEKFVTTVSWTRILHGTYLIFTSPLAYLSVGRFLFYVIQRNDLQQRLLFYTNVWNARSKQNCNLRSQDRGLCICSVISDATH